MVKGIFNAFDHMELCLVINLAIGGNQAVAWPPVTATRYLVLLYLKYQLESTCYPQEKLISNTDAFDHMEFCSVTNRTIGRNWAVAWPPVIAARYFSFATTLNTR